MVPRSSARIEPSRLGARQRCPPKARKSEEITACAEGSPASSPRLAGRGLEHIIGDIEAGALRRPPQLTTVVAVVRNADVYDFNPLINRRTTQQA
jgi:hypothetical protein